MRRDNKELIEKGVLVLIAFLLGALVQWSIHDCPQLPPEPTTMEVGDTAYTSGEMFSAWAYATLVVEDGPDTNPWQVTPAFWSDGVEWGKVDWPYNSQNLSNALMFTSVVEWYWDRHEAWDWRTRILMYRHGPTGIEDGRELDYDYLERVLNLMQEWLKHVREGQAPARPPGATVRSYR